MQSRTLAREVSTTALRQSAPTLSTRGKRLAVPAASFQSRLAPQKPQNLQQQMHRKRGVLHRDARRRIEMGGTSDRQESSEGLGLSPEILVQDMLIQHSFQEKYMRTADTQSNEEHLLFVKGSAALVMALGVANRVLYKMVLNPLSDYVFFLAQFQTFSYVLVYFAILAYKLKWSKTVKPEDLQVTDKKIFLYIGAAEALSQVLGFIGASKLPGVVIPLLSQGVLLWQIGVGRVVLGKKLSSFQIGGALLVVAGVCVAAWPGNGGGSAFSEVSLTYAGIFAFSMFFPAISSIFKERIFTEAQEKLQGRKLDLFAVNSFGSAAQALFVFLLLPVLSSLRGISLGQLPTYLGQGLSCMMGGKSGCEAAPLLASLYVSCNLGFNIALLNLLRAAGNVVQSLTLSVIVPLTIATFTLDLPYVGESPELGLNFFTGTGILFGGLLVFNANKYLPIIQEKLKQK